MTNIRRCLTTARGGVGYFANGEEGRRTIGGALINDLGPIERGLLTYEVSRAYDEVMNTYLAPNQLNPVRTEADVNTAGTILHTLDRMHKTTKRTLSSF